ncbi:hypothetical protein TVAG_303900 [Trichomonas vaginalis G3]|uniref:Uncharacterized protein n=1 Tax=Trichomonas vaginalis (strain ATCC PRA-98 / G3) TaxID=412133 RepID=A2DR71_TRIV3|nr:hypothetical protein TVAGG3_0695720 [Trichomonas vaginalis G3]EAY17170.1 hypothetical protein TVAG_303900 [Trichomonas vaginalis G3]KAI5508901.1 hypothetical protein TVAGG3_0695720 [Trichomonas vaginalis G3]|eukprot:XP_001329393.1 hypothetical protein [Trichomonas vaginalis G3]
MSDNPLLKPEKSIKLGNDYTAGKVTDPSIVTESVEKILKNGLLEYHYLMRNLTLLYYYAPYKIDLKAAILKAMIDVAKKSDYQGSINFQIVRLIFDSQFSLSLMCLKENSHKEVIDQMVLFMGELSSEQDKKNCQALRIVIQKALKDNSDYSFVF